MINGPQFFSKIEFLNKAKDWWPLMSPRLVTLLDVLRFRLGVPIYISDNSFALGRYLGPSSMSAHNIDQWGEVLAADTFVSGVYTRKQAENVVHIAITLGFTGIGVYADTRNNQGEPQVMFHFDVRPNERMGVPATWGRVHGAYSSMIEALKQLPAEVPK